jgi:arylsulfatase A-like enzyme
MQSYDILPEGEDWTFDAPGSRQVRTTEGVALELGAGRSDQRLLAQRQVQIDLQPLDRVVLRGQFEGSGSLVARILRNGSVMLDSEPLALPEQSEIVDFVLDLRPVGDAREPGALPADTLQFECTGSYRRLVVISVQLQGVSPSSVLPDPREPPAWVTLEGSSRLAVGLYEDLPLVGEVDVPPNALLDLSLAAADVTGGVRLNVSDGTRRERYGLVVPNRNEGWTDLIVPLPGWAGRRVTIELHWDRPSAAIVGPISIGSAVEPQQTLLFVTSSSHRGDHLAQIFRGIDIDTPVLDALAGRGVLFTDAFSVTNLPGPGLASLHTGRTPRDSRLLDEADRLSDDATTLAERLSAVGWRCEAVLATRSLRPRNSGLGQGYFHVEAPRDRWRWSAPEVVARALARLRANADRPLFLWVHLADGEWPHEPDDADLARYYNPTDDPKHEGYRRPKLFVHTLPEVYRDVRDLSWARARYKTCITALDRALGPLLNEARVLAGTTAFAGSQGLSLGEHSIWFKNVGLYPGLLHVPLIVASGDSSWPLGMRCDTPVSTLGLAATLALGVGASAEGWQGDDLLAVARGEVVPGARFAVEDHAQSAAVTVAGMHLIASLQERKSAHLFERRKLGELELFDLSLDWKGEQPVRMQDHPAGKQMGLLLSRWLDEAQDLGWSRPGVLDAARATHLLELGYTGLPPRTPENPWSLDH